MIFAEDCRKGVMALAQSPKERSFLVLPKPATQINVRTLYDMDHWRSLKEAFAISGESCRVCWGSKRVQMHEEWEVKPEGILRLSGLMALCGRCHFARHGSFDDVPSLYYARAWGEKRRLKWKFKRYAKEIVCVDPIKLALRLLSEVEKAEDLEEITDWRADLSILYQVVPSHFSSDLMRPGQNPLKRPDRVRGNDEIQSARALRRRNLAKAIGVKELPCCA